MAAQPRSNGRGAGGVADEASPADRAGRAVSDPRLAAWGAFLRAHAGVKAILERELLDERDLPLTWYEVLLHVRAYGGTLRMQELARSVLLSKSGLTRLVDRMEAKGLVRRRTCESDRRGAYVAITDAGEAAFRAAAPVHLRGVTEHFTAHLSDEELRVLEVALTRVARGAERERPDPCEEDAASTDGPEGHAPGAACG